MVSGLKPTKISWLAVVQTLIFSWMVLFEMSRKHKGKRQAGPVSGCPKFVLRAVETYPIVNPSQSGMRQLKKGAEKEEPMLRWRQEGAGRSSWWLAINLQLGAGWWQNKPSCWATSTPRSPSTTSTLPLSGGHFKSLSLQYWGQRIQHF